MISMLKMMIFYLYNCRSSGTTLRIRRCGTLLWPAGGPGLISLVSFQYAHGRILISY